MLPAAPPLYSITTCWPRNSPSVGVIWRATRSLEPPGGNGTISLTGLTGYGCACATAKKTSARRPPIGVPLSAPFQEVRHRDPVHHGARVLQQLSHRTVFIGPQIHAELTAELASVEHDPLAQRLAVPVVGGESIVDLVVTLQRLDQRQRVAACLGHAEAHVRPRGGRGVADQRDAPEHELRRRKVVDRREE